MYMAKKYKYRSKPNDINGAKLVIIACIIAHVIIYFATFGFLFALWFYSAAIGLIMLANIAILTNVKSSEVFIRATILFNLVFVALGVLVLVQNYHYFFS